ncbi:hypothetical protein Barb6_03019 [Bacteroidales bacterium Barb6]|nr:hypothetical protein Barb6_03019 [Bacteroidales bacterium Barb6]
MQQVLHVNIRRIPSGGIAHDAGIQPASYLAVDTVEGTATYKKDILCIYRNCLLVGMLATALRRDVHDRTFQQFQQSLLYTLPAHVTGDRGVIPLAGNLVKFINKDDAALGSRHVIVGNLQQAGQQTFNVLSHITGFGEHRSINNGKGHMQQLGYRPRQQCFPRTGSPHHNNVGLLYFHIVRRHLLRDALIMVIDRHGKPSLGVILSDDILIQKRLDTLRLRQLILVQFKGVTAVGRFLLLLYYIVCLLGATVAYSGSPAVNHHSHVFVFSPAERAHIAYFHVF